MESTNYYKAANLITGSKMTVALSGAGISTPSGIPDFRSPDSGLWTKVDPSEVASIDSFNKNPSSFFNFLKPLSEKMGNALPNDAHKVLSDWEKVGLLHSIITQNIDNLHQKAGSQNVLELHGNAQKSSCTKCGKYYSHEDLIEKLEISNVPHCDCISGGVIKPDVILFGEQLPLNVLQQSEKDCKDCQLIIVAGSSLTVTPASILPRIALQSGSKLIIINKQKTYIDIRADVVIRESIEIAFAKIDSAVKQLMERKQ